MNFLKRWKMKIAYRRSQQIMNSIADQMIKLDSVESEFMIKWLFALHASRNPKHWTSVADQLSRAIHLCERDGSSFKYEWPVNIDFDYIDHDRYRYARRANIK